MEAALSIAGRVRRDRDGARRGAGRARRAVKRRAGEGTRAGAAQRGDRRLRPRRLRRPRSTSSPPPTRSFPAPSCGSTSARPTAISAGPVEAVAAFDRFLRDAGDAPPETLAEARRSAAELKTKLGQIEVTCATDGAEVTVDGKQVGSTPLGEMVWTTPGRHQVAVQHAGVLARDRGRRRRRRQGRRRQHRAAARSICGPRTRPATTARWERAARARPPRTSPIYRRTWFWVAAGVVVGAGATTAVICRDARRRAGSETTLGAQRAF